MTIGLLLNHILNLITIWLVVEPPLWKIWVRQLGLLFPTEWKNIKFMFQTPNQIKSYDDLNHVDFQNLSIFIQRSMIKRC